jgi:hypothetical protein
MSQLLTIVGEPEDEQTCQNTVTNDHSDN